MTVIVTVTVVVTETVLWGLPVGVISEGVGGKNVGIGICVGVGCSVAVAEANAVAVRDIGDPVWEGKTIGTGGVPGEFVARTNAVLTPRIQPPHASTNKRPRTP